MQRSRSISIWFCLVTDSLWLSFNLTFQSLSTNSLIMVKIINFDNYDAERVLRPCQKSRLVHFQCFVKSINRNWRVMSRLFIHLMRIIMSIALGLQIVHSAAENLDVGTVICLISMWHVTSVECQWITQQKWKPDESLLLSIKQFNCSDWSVINELSSSFIFCRFLKQLWNMIWIQMWMVSERIEMCHGITGITWQTNSNFLDLCE